MLYHWYRRVGYEPYNIPIDDDILQYVVVYERSRTLSLAVRASDTLRLCSPQPSARRPSEGPEEARNQHADDGI